MSPSVYRRRVYTRDQHSYLSQQPAGGLWQQVSYRLHLLQLFWNSIHFLWAYKVKFVLEHPKLSLNLKLFRSGVVNVYEAQSVLKSSTPQPAKALLHLVTSATFVKFNPTSQILTMASDDKEGALKLVCTVIICIYIWPLIVIQLLSI